MVHRPSAMGLVQHSVSIISALTSIAILATSAYMLGSYRNQTHKLNSWWLPLWPEHFDTCGTKTQVGVATVLVVLKFFSMGLHASPKIRNADCATSVTVLSTSALSAILAIAAIAVTSRAERSTPRDTIGSWSCQYRGPQMEDTTQNWFDMFWWNGNFESLCGASNFAYWAMPVVLVLEVVLIVGAAVSFFATPKVTEFVRDEKSSDTSSH